jgi:hypothetical protein
LGSIIYGQSKDLLIPLPAELLPNCEFSLTYDTLQEKRKSIKFNINKHPRREDLHLIAQQKFRLRFVHAVRTTLEEMRKKLKNPAITTEKIEAAKNQMKALEEEMRQYPDKDDGFVKDLLTDLTGQVDEATSREDWFGKWGVHFLPSLTRKFLFETYMYIYCKIIFF